MPIPAFRKFNFPDKDLVQVQESVGRTLDPIISIPFMSGNLVENISIPVGAVVSVEHKLGRDWRGYLVTSLVAGSSAFYPTAVATGYDRTKFIRIFVPSAVPVTLSLWVF